MKNKKSSRDAYVRAEVATFLAHQIRALRMDRGLSQKDLADALGTKQTAIARMEDPSYGKLSLKTLFNLSSAFDVGLEVRFISFVDMLEDTYLPKAEKRSVYPFSEEKNDVTFYEKDMPTNDSPSSYLPPINCTMQETS